MTDFGIARAVNTEESLTQTGAVMGTATYFSPEQAEGLGVDARSDIYSLGVVLFEMVTGRPPFLGESPVAVASKHVRDLPPPPSELNPADPAGLRGDHPEGDGQGPEPTATQRPRTCGPTSSASPRAGSVLAMDDPRPVSVAGARPCSRLGGMDAPSAVGRWTRRRRRPPDEDGGPNRTRNYAIVAGRPAAAPGDRRVLPRPHPRLLRWGRLVQSAQCRRPARPRWRPRPCEPTV